MIKKVITDFKEAQVMGDRLGYFTGLEKLDENTFESISVFYRNKNDLEDDEPEKATINTKYVIHESRPDLIDLMAVAYGNRKQKSAAYKKFEKDGNSKYKVNKFLKNYLKEN